MTRPFQWTGLAILLAVSLIACRSTVVDTTPPTVHISGPATSTATFVGEPFELRGSSEDDTGVSRVMVSMAGGEPFETALQADGTWMTEITPSSAGRLTLTATAFDAAGNQSEESRVQYLTHHRGRSFFVDTFGMDAGSTSAGVHVYVAMDGQLDRTEVPVTAEVSLNGTILPLLPAGTSFQGPLPADVLVAGGLVELLIKDGATEVGVEFTLPLVPTQTAPEDGRNFALGEPVIVDWTIDEDPDYYQILVLSESGGGWSSRIPGDQRTFELDTSELPTDGSQIRTRVVAMNAVDLAGFTGPAANGSNTLTTARSNFRTISIGSP